MKRVYTDYLRNILNTRGDHPVLQYDRGATIKATDMQYTREIQNDDSHKRRNTIIVYCCSSKNHL